MVLLAILLLTLILTSGLIIEPRLRARRNQRLAAADRLRLSRRVADEDVTRFGEELTELHVETLTADIGTEARQDYQRALDSYESAKQILQEERSTEGVTRTTKALEGGRFAMACVLARTAGDPLPERRPPCFFNPAHGPAQTDVEWAPPGGVLREIPVCFADAARLEAGSEPDTRRVRVGSRLVPWYQGGPAYAAYAAGYYGTYIRDGVFPTFIVASMLLTSASWAGWDSGAGQPTGPVGDWGGWDGGDPGGGGDSGGGWGSGDPGGGWGGGGDSGGYDSGGFDGGIGGFDGGGGGL